MTSKKLDLRTQPKQSRARDRVASILAVTEEMLASGEKVTTSSIAKKAKIPVGSVYRYFPDINAIYRQLFEMINSEMLDRVQATFQKQDPNVNWNTTFVQCMEIMRDTYKSNPAFGDLLLMMESPELRESKANVTDNIATAIAQRLRDGPDEFFGDDPVIVARTVVEMATANELSYFLEKDPETRDRLYSEWAKAIGAYLKVYLKD